MGLLDLPPEIFQRIVQVLVKKRGIVEAWKVRGTSKAFRCYIDYEVLATPKLNAYIKSPCGRKILKNNVSRFLFLRSNKLNGFVRNFLPNFIRDVISDAEPYVGGDDAVTTLRKTLCDLLVRKNAKAYTLLIADIGAISTIWAWKGFEATNASNRIAVAAAAGSLETIQNLGQENHRLFWYKSAAFGYPLEAAVYAGHSEIVDFLAHRAVIYMTKVIVKHSGLDLISFRQAIGTGIKLHRVAMVKLLLSTYFEIFGSATVECTRDWLDIALEFRDEECMRILQTIPTQAGTSTFYRAFDSSCKLNASKISRIFFEEGRLRVDELCSHTYPVLSAMGDGCRHVLQALLNMGANPDGPFYLGATARPLELAMMRGHMEFACQLLQKGANPHLVTAPRSGSYVSLFKEHAVFQKLMKKAMKKCKKPA